MFYLAAKITKIVGREVAFAGCWIVDQSVQGARQKGLALIRSQGWEVLEILEEFTILREDYDDNAEGLQYFDQALDDGEVCVIFVGQEQSTTPPASGQKTPPNAGGGGEEG